MKTPTSNPYRMNKKKKTKKNKTVVCLAHTGGCTHVTALALMRVWVRNYQIIFPASTLERTCSDSLVNSD